LITFTTNLEHIGDIIEKNLLELARKKILNQLTFSDEGWAELNGLHDRVLKHMQLAMSVFVSRDLSMARRLLGEKDEFRELEREGREKHLERLRSGLVQSIETSAVHLDILRDLKRIHSHLTSVAYPILESEGELRRSRRMTRAEDEAAETEADAQDTERAVPTRRPARPSGGA
jgi:phosphate:Na+ symporter